MSPGEVARFTADPGPFPVLGRPWRAIRMRSAAVHWWTASAIRVPGPVPERAGSRGGRRKGAQAARGVRVGPVVDPLLELILLVYLLNAKDEALAQEMITVQQLKDAHFFQGPHDLHTRPLIERYGRDRKAFRDAAASLGGVAIDAGDAGFRIQALPRVPLYYLLWEGDDEFEPRLSVLFDRSIEKHLPRRDGGWCSSSRAR